MGELANCARCGDVFVKQLRDICPKCYREEEAAYKTVYTFLTKRKGREATIQEIVEATEVEEELIIKFIKEKRLRQSQFPKLAYPCERCGTNIVTGKLCQNCLDEITNDLEQHNKELALKQKREKEVQTVYYTFDRRKNN